MYENVESDKDYISRVGTGNLLGLTPMSNRKEIFMEKRQRIVCILIWFS